MDHTLHKINEHILPQSFLERVISYFSQNDFMPHGHCYFWNPGLVSAHVISDLLIGGAYFLISLTLYKLVKRINLPFSAVVLSFGLFIAACGATHYIEIWNLWNADYWFSAWVKILTALASVATAAYLLKLREPIFQFAKAAKESELHRHKLVKLNEELSQQKDTLETINRELESFSYSVSHDLRTPLRNINGFSQALYEDHFGHLSNEGLMYLDSIRTGIHKMGLIIDDLLNLARITKGDIKLEEVNLSAIAEGIISELKNQDPSRQVEISIQGELLENGDSGLIKIALENLLSNSWKFTSKKDLARIEFGCIDKSGKRTYFMKDNGAGFDMNQVSRLFTAFQRLHSDHDFPGTGVGLATVKRIIQRHKGEIWAESMIKEGATFYFTIGEGKSSFHLSEGHY